MGSVVHSGGRRSEAVNHTLARFEAGFGRRLDALVSALAFASVELALGSEAFDSDSGNAVVEGHSHKRGAMSGQRALATVESVHGEMG